MSVIPLQATSLHGSSHRSRYPLCSGVPKHRHTGKPTNRLNIEYFFAFWGTRNYYYDIGTMHSKNRSTKSCLELVGKTDTILKIGRRRNLLRYTRWKRMYAGSKIGSFSVREIVRHFHASEYIDGSLSRPFSKSSVIRTRRCLRS